MKKCRITTVVAARVARYAAIVVMWHFRLSSLESIPALETVPNALAALVRTQPPAVVMAGKAQAPAGGEEHQGRMNAR